MGPARAWFPLVGLGLGGVLLGLDIAGAGGAARPLLVGAILVAVLLVLTRAIHTEGFLDCCDGLFGGYTREERLRILRDSHVGAFAVDRRGGAAAREVERPRGHPGRRSDGPAAGVPVPLAVRDARDDGGIPRTSGSRGWEQRVPGGAGLVAGDAGSGHGCRSGRAVPRGGARSCSASRLRWRWGWGGGWRGCWAA